MPEFLKLQSVNQAREKFLKHLPELALKTEEVDTIDSSGRVVGKPIQADIFSPAFNRSTVDGYAVKSKDTQGTSDSIPLYLKYKGEVPMGSAPGFALDSGEAALIHTGGMIPEGADAVVMLEHAQRMKINDVEVFRPVSPGENVLIKGEDIQPGDIVIPAGKMIRPEEIGGLMSLGRLKVVVFSQPLVSIFSSGDELVPPHENPTPGKVRDINSHSLAALVRRSGGIPVIHPLLADDPNRLEEELRKVLPQSDLVVITAGSSASERDMTAEVVNRLGSPGVLVHGINVRPGKPTILAVCDGKPVIGLPGNPVSALVIARLFVCPLVDRLSGMQEVRLEGTITARLTVNLASQAGRDDYYPVVLTRKGDGWLADPVFFKSNLIFSLVRADGLALIPSAVTGYAAGELVEVILL